MFVNVNGTWKRITGMFVNVSGTWKRITNGFVNVAGTWKRFFSSALTIAQQVTISKTTNATTYLQTLTGTNYYWSPGPPVLTYKFQWSTNGGSSWTDIDSGSIVNPAFGSSNTVSYQLSNTSPGLYVSPNVLNEYQFRVDATYGSLSANSISNTVSIQGPTNTTLSLTGTTYGSISLGWTASTGANKYILYKSSDNITFTVVGVAQTAISATGISGLTGGNTYYFKVIPITGDSTTYPGYYGNYSNTLTLPILATPTLSASTSQLNGFYFSINNYDSLNTYNISTNSGSVSRSGSTVTVTGLADGASATVTIYAQRSGYGDSDTATRTGTAAQQYTVTWSSTSNVGLPVGTTISVSPPTSTGFLNTTVTAPTPTASNIHYTFLYWRDTLSAFTYLYQVGGGASWTINGNLTFYSWWTANTYTITYNANGGSVSPTSASVTYPNSATLPTPTRSGYSFNGWYTASSGGTFVGNAGSSYQPISNITLYAQWTIIQYTVTWDANGGSVTPTSNTVNAGSSVTAPTPTRAGYTFSTWRNPLSGGDPILVAAGGTYIPTASITFYAIWTANSYTISYNGNGNDGGTAPASQTYTTGGTAVTISGAGTLTRTGFNFAGWNTNSSGTGTNYSSGDSYSTSANLTLYARWTAITYTITWNANGGTVSPTSSTGTSGTTVTAPTPTRSGYTFQYWRNPLSGGDPVFLNAGATYTISGNFTWYAIWVINAAPDVPSGISLTRNQSTWNGTSWTWSCSWSAPVANTTYGTATYYEAYRQVGTGTVGNATLTTIANTSTPQTNITATSTTFSTTVQAAPRADAYVRACNSYGCSAYASGNVG